MKLAEVLSKGQSNSRIAGLDLLRVLAVVLVVLYHYPVHPNILGIKTAFDQGWIGVDLFFVLSGVLIGGQVFHAIQRDGSFSMGRFMGRRLFRTLPNYWFVLFVFYVLWPSQPFGAASPVWRYLLFTQNFFGMKAFMPSWSLCIEEHFYLFFPIAALLLIRLVSKRGWSATIKWACVVALSAQIAIRTWIWLIVRPDLAEGATFDEQYQAFFEWIQYPTFTHLDGIVAGIGISAVQVFRPDWWSGLLLRKYLLLAVGLGLVGLSAVLHHHHRAWPGAIFGYTVLSSAFGAWAIAAHGFRTLPWLLGVIVQKLAELSFAIYLLTEPILHLCISWAETSGFGGWKLAVVFISILLASSFLLYKVIERPALLLRDRYLGNPAQIRSRFGARIGDRGIP